MWKHFNVDIKIMQFFMDQKLNVNNNGVSNNKIMFFFYIFVSVGQILRWNWEKEVDDGSANIQKEVLRLLPLEVHQWRLQFRKFPHQQQQWVWGVNGREEADENGFDEKRKLLGQRTVTILSVFRNFSIPKIHFWFSAWSSLTKRTFTSETRWTIQNT